MQLFLVKNLRDHTYTHIGARNRGYKITRIYEQRGTRYLDTGILSRRRRRRRLRRDNSKSSRQRSYAFP